MLAYSSFVHAAPLSPDPPSVPSSPSSQSGALTADKGPGPSTEMETLTAAQQGVLHAVSLYTTAPHSVVGVYVCLYLWCVCMCVCVRVCLCVHVCFIGLAQALHT